MIKRLIKEILLIIFIVFTSIFFASIYGFLHDQITYTISEEYYTKFKFIQFNFWYPDQGPEAKLQTPRLAAGIVGVFATWWTGPPLGLIFGLFLIKIKSVKSKIIQYFYAIRLMLIIAISLAIIGLLISGFFIEGQIEVLQNSSHKFNHIVDKKNFLRVGWIHNFSYLGAIIGLIISSIYLYFKNKKRQEKDPAPKFD